MRVWHQTQQTGVYTDYDRGPEGRLTRCDDGWYSVAPDGRIGSIQKRPGLALRDLWRYIETQREGEKMSQHQSGASGGEQVEGSGVRSQDRGSAESGCHCGCHPDLELATYGCNAEATGRTVAIFDVPCAGCGRMGSFTVDWDVEVQW